MCQDLLEEPLWRVVCSPPMEVGWALFFGSSLATAMLCPAATGDTCTSARILCPEHAGTCGGQPGLVYHIQEDAVAQTISHDWSPTTGAWICPLSALESRDSCWGAAGLSCPSLVAGQKAGRKHCTLVAEQIQPAASPDHLSNNVEKLVFWTRCRAE